MENMKLRGKMAEHGFTQRALAKQVNMSENSLAAKIRGERSFKINEVSAICEILQITNPVEITDIFFEKVVSKNGTFCSDI